MVTTLGGIYPLPRLGNNSLGAICPPPQRVSNNSRGFLHPPWSLDKFILVPLAQSDLLNYLRHVSTVHIRDDPVSAWARAGVYAAVRRGLPTGDARRRNGSSLDASEHCHHTDEICPGPDE